MPGSGSLVSGEPLSLPRGLQTVVPSLVQREGVSFPVLPGTMGGHALLFHADSSISAPVVVESIRSQHALMWKIERESLQLHSLPNFPV